MVTPVERLAYFIKEREAIRLKKESGAPPPWTKDPILSRYRFTNVHRENDKVTRWLKQHWRDPHEYDPYLWHAMIIARFINWPPTLEEIGWPEPWGVPEVKFRVSSALRARKRRGEKVFTGAYLVSTNGATMDKVDHVLQLFTRAWKEMTWSNTLRSRRMPLAAVHASLMLVNGIGSFMAAQVIADLKYTPVLRNATDWHDWAAPGPGSLRGLSRVRGLGTGSRWKTSAFIPELLELREELRLLVGDTLGSDLQDLQNCLCEWGKYEKTRLGQGKPRSTYAPHTYD